MQLLHFVSCVSLLLGVSCASQLYSCDQTLSTSNGPITGHAASNETAVCEYLGIPYAKPPVGELRFAAPQAYNGTSSYIADQYGADCPQTDSKPFAYPNGTAQLSRIITNFANSAGNGHVQSEDCLTLNIWSKSGSSESLKPVVVFFYGGRYAIGSSNTPYYDGQFLANSQDVIVVTLNYRVTIFGFPGAPGETQNVALLDQRRAVEWVRDNIEAFGGDSSRIIIDGQSSGAVAVDNWAYAWKDDPIVSGLISQSGNVFSFPLNDAELAGQNWYNVSGQLGCGTTGDTLECMRDQNITAILAAVGKVPAPPGSSVARSQPTFQGTIDNVTVFADYDVRSNSGDFARIPYLQGINNYETGYYRYAALAKGSNPSEATWTEFELEDFTCPTAFEGFNRARYNVSSWRFRYFGDWDNLRLYPGSGAYHGSDVEMVIGNTEGVSGIAPSWDEEQLTAYMQGAWAAFARDPEDGLSNYGWPKYDQTAATLARLGYNNSYEPDFVLPSLYDEPCAGLNLTYWNDEVL